MPTYEYQCSYQPCKYTMDVVHKMSEYPEIICPKCLNSVMVKKIGMGSGLHFKGSGFYETDYKGK